MADPDADWEAKCGELEKMNKKLKAKLRKTLQEKDELIAAAAAAPAGDGSAAPAEGAAPAAGGDGDSAERIAALETEVHEGKVLIKKLKTKVRQLMAEAAEGGGGGGGEAAAGEAAGGEAAAGVDMAKFNKMKRNLGKYKKAYEKNEALNKKLKAKCKQLIAKNKQLAASGGGGGEGDDDTDGGGGGDSAALAKALATNKKLKVKCRALIAELDEARAGGGAGDGSGEGTLSGTDGGSESAAAAVAPYKRKLAEAKREIEKLKVKLRATLRAARDGGGGDDDNGGEGGSSGAADGDGDGASGAEVTDLKARLKKEKALNSKLKARVRELQAAAADGGSGGGDGGADSAALEEAQAAAATAAAQLEEVRVELKVAERKFEESEAEMARIAEMSNDIEMLNLDKEIAEVRAETLEYEIRELQEEIEDLRLEIEIYKEEEEEATAGDDDESKDEKIKRSSKKYRSMAKQNKKLKEALVHVREISLADQTEFRSMIDELEAQCRAVPELTKQVETYTAQVAELEAAAVELQEAAAAGEALQSEFETATARVEELEAEAEDLKAAVKDLDDLLKVADEIDMGHTEHEDDLMQEIEDRYSDIDRLRAAGVAKDEEIRALQRQLASLRELVLSLETQVREGGGAGVPATEAAADDGGAGVGAGGAAEDADIDRAMALHRLTQHKKDEAREMELALLRKDAEQGAAHVSMLEEFMPPFFFASNNEHIMFLLFVERLAFKTDMIVDNFTSKYDMRAGTRNGVPVSTDEVAFGARVLATLAPFAQALTQIQAELARTDEETFLRVASQYRDLLPYEERLDKFIRQVRTDGVSFASDLGDLKEMATRFSFLEREDLKVGELPSGTAFVYDMDAKHHQAAVLLTAFRAFSDLIKNESEGQDSESTVALLAQAGKIDDALSKAVKTFVKFDRKYEKTPVELPNEPLRMLDEAQGVLDTQTEVAHNLCEKFRTALVNSPTGKVGAPEVSALIEGVCGAGGLGSFLNAAQTFRDNVADVTEGAINRHYVARGSGGGEDGAGGDDPDHVPVWHTRAEAVKEKIARAADVELRLDEALADAHARLTELKVKDQAVKDMQVKADVLAKRIETLQGEAAAVDELRDELAAAQKEEEHYKEAIAHLEADLHALEQRTNTARKKTGRNSSPRGNPLASLLSSVTTPTAASPSSPGFPGANDSGHSSIGSPLNRSRPHGGSSPSSVNATNASVLQDLVHHLRRDNARLHATDAMRRMKKLRPLTTGAQLRAGTKKEDAPRLLRMRRRQSRASIVTAAISYDDCKREVSSLLRFTRSMMASSTVVDLQAEDGMDITAQWSQRLASLSRLQKRSAEIRHKAQAVIMEKKQGAAKSTLIAPFPTPELNRVLAVDENTPLIGRVRIPKRSVAPALQQKLGIADGSTAKIVIGRRDMVKLHSVFASA